jgi:hypothetical protein
MHKVGTKLTHCFANRFVLLFQSEVSGKREEEDAHLPYWRLRLVPKITSCSHTQDRQSVQHQTQSEAMKGMLGVQS